MKTIHTVAFVLGCLALSMLAVACASQAQLDAGHELIAVTAKVSDPASPAGTALSPEEELELRASYDRLQGAEGLNWSQVGAAALGSLALLFPALRYLPNRFILGTAPDPDVKRVAGLPS